MTIAPDTTAITARLGDWLERRIGAEASRWLAEARAQVAGGSDAALNRAFSLVPRRIGRADLALSADDVTAADRARPGWQPAGWTTDQAARLLLLLTAAGDGPAFARRLEALIVTADVAELVTLYRGLPLYPEPERHVARALEGARSNMAAVFEAVALGNPYPAEQFTDAAWNQMVLKALFIGSRLARICGLEARANVDLARMLCDYAHERWAAGRPVSGELWRCVGPFADDAALADLARALDDARDAAGQAGAALALSHCPHPQAAALLGRHPGLRDAIAAGALSWATWPNGEP